MFQQLPPLLDYAFLSAPDSPETFIISRSGAVRHWQEGIGNGLPVKRREQTLPSLFVMENVSSSKWKWRKNYLPILEAGSYTLFALKDELWCKTPDGCFAYPGKKPLSEERFNAEARNIELFWDKWLASGRCLPPMTPALDGAWRMSLIHSRCAFWGTHCKYGVEKYGEFRADGFPPTIISICNTFLAFEHTAEARELFSCYITRFVRPNGTLDYYGSSFAEYGMLLDTASRLASGSGGEAFFDALHAPLTALCRYIYNQLNPWLTEPGSYYYLPCGSPEADRRKDKGEYFHNAAWLCKGLNALEKAAGKWMPREELWELHHIAEVLKRRTERAFNERRAALNGFPPYAVHQTEAIGDHADSVEYAYANYRYYPEMLSSGFFDKETMEAIINIRETRHGEIFGMTRFYWKDYPEELADHWTLFSYAQGLLDLGDRDRFMALLKAHLLNYISPDLFYAYESVTLHTTPRFAYSDWCIPAQLVLPQMLLASFNCWDGPDKDIQELF